VTNPEDEREVLDPADDEYTVPATRDALPLEAEPADVLEQAQAVPADDDDEYRSG
jgi:hypothetical protein